MFRGASSGAIHDPLRARCAERVRKMRAMQLAAPGEPLRLISRDIGKPDPGQLLLRVLACGVCRTDLHIVDGELPRPDRTVIPGHEIVGEVIERGARVERFGIGERVGVPWLGSTMRFSTGQPSALAIFSLACSSASTRWNSAAPPLLSMKALLCAGLIGYRALSIAGDAQTLGIYGFGAAAHIVAQVARFQGRKLFAFTRPGDAQAQRFALALGAAWAGGSDAAPPEPLDAAIPFAPVGALVPAALRAVSKGGTVVCAGIHMSEIPAFPYEILWGERRVVSVANLTRRDGEEFLALAPRVPVRTSVEIFPLERANEALARVREGRINGAAVLVMPERAAHSG